MKFLANLSGPTVRNIFFIVQCILAWKHTIVKSRENRNTGTMLSTNYNTQTVIKISDINASDRE